MVNKNSKTNINFLIRKLEPGGAERQMLILANGLLNYGYKISIICFYSDGGIEEEAIKSGIKVISINKKGRWHVFLPLFSLIKILKKNKPDILHSYLPTANIMAIVARIFIPGMKVVWGVRGSFNDLSDYDWLRSVSYYIESLLSRYPDLIICNSERGRISAIKRGFPENKLKVIYNGIDTYKYHENHGLGEKQRKIWGINDTAPVIGMVARFDPVKDHKTFLSAAKIILGKVPNALFVCVGIGNRENFEQIKRMIVSMGLGSKVICEYDQHDLVAIYNTFDIAVLTSAYGEGFPNTIAEAMSCGVPCVSTDVGDAQYIIGNNSLVVKPGDPVGLSDVWFRLINNPPELTSLGMIARKRILNKFSQDKLYRDTDECFKKIVN